MIGERHERNQSQKNAEKNADELHAGELAAPSQPTSSERMPRKPSGLKIRQATSDGRAWNAHCMSWGWASMPLPQGRNTMNHEPVDLRDAQPSSWRHIIGQTHVTHAFQIACESSFAEKKRLDELLLCGPPGLGKSGLVTVLATELGVNMTEVLAQSVTNSAQSMPSCFLPQKEFSFLTKFICSIPCSNMLCSRCWTSGEFSSAAGGPCSRFRWLPSLWSAQPQTRTA